MQASDMKLGKVLSNSQLFVIPLFQRPYVWTRERNWEPLWDDIRQAAESVEEEWAPGGNAEPATYFLGAIVTQERRRAPQRLSSMNIIDGQQRMSTLQVLLAAARSVAARQGCDAVAGRLEGLVLNNERVVHPDHPEDKQKLLPLPQDRDAYLWATRPPGSEVSRPREQKRLCDAREWFEAQIESWAIGEEVDTARRLDALHFALDERIQIVHIMLEANEDPQVIFEALNGRGEPLVPADLIKNLLFQAVELQGDQWKADELLLRGWLPFDSAPWRDSVTTGRITRAFIDVFLSYWLTAETGREVSVDHLFIAFERWLEQSGARAGDVIRRLRADGETFLSMRELDPRTPLGALIDSMEATKTSTPWPVLLNLQTRGDVPPSEVELAAQAIDSFITRRAICGRTTKDYNRLLLHVLALAKEAPGERAGQVVRDALAAQSADSRSWPSDTEFLAGLLESRLFEKQYRARMRALLIGLENFLRTELSEDTGSVSATKSELTVEHLLPQKWREHWPTREPTDEAAQEREDSVHRLGNLTLLTHSLNPKVSNRAWALKSAELRRHALLRLTTSSVFAAPPNAEDEWSDQEWSSDWNEERIRRRSLWLAEIALAAWPRPEGGLDIEWMDKLEFEPSAGPRDRRVFTTTVAHLISAGLIHVQDELVWNRSKVGEVHTCVVLPDGSLQLKDGRVRRTPSGAAVALAGGQFDGWSVWRVPSSENRTLAEIRAQYLGG